MSQPRHRLEISVLFTLTLTFHFSREGHVLYFLPLAETHNQCSPTRHIHHETFFVFRSAWHQLHNGGNVKPVFLGGFSFFPSRFFLFRKLVDK